MPHYCSPLNSIECRLWQKHIHGHTIRSSFHVQRYDMVPLSICVIQHLNTAYWHISLQDHENAANRAVCFTYCYHASCHVWQCPMQEETCFAMARDFECRKYRCSMLDSLSDCQNRFNVQCKLKWKIEELRQQYLTIKITNVSIGFVASK